MAATTTAFEVEILTGFPVIDRGLMAGAAYRLRQAYLDGMADPAAHTRALAGSDNTDALARSAKTASFAAITGP